ncbi:hypothetical protein PU560_04110 [Georgenia sp. 10Sc9-8]|uniref:Transposase n=1 Tax=Georgenia halotolerans TaxID=3028317 RepID=A0ABT5TUB2_9MICO|nr:hypothetical protein [Georgenia halotolerans]
MFAALAISRYFQHAAEVSIKKLVRTLRPLRSVVIDIDGHQLTADPAITTEARAILNRLPPITTGH